MKGANPERRGFLRTLRRLSMDGARPVRQTELARELGYQTDNEPGYLFLVDILRNEGLIVSKTHDSGGVHKTISLTTAGLRAAVPWHVRLVKWLGKHLVQLALGLAAAVITAYVIKYLVGN